MPYYTELDDHMAERYISGNGIQQWDTQVYTYYPEISIQQEDGSYRRSDVGFAGEEDIKDSYLEVPESNYETIRNFCKDLGVTDKDSKEQIINKLILYFQDNIPYTLRPGSMPRGADFVNYFLEKNKKGFCAHFASAATLIFRYYGIPARYVEGYAIDYSQVMDADLVENKKYEDFFEGDAPLGKTAVVKVSARDADAHAWVEVYLDHKWETVEVTPSSDEEEIDDFWSVFGNMLSGGDDNRDAVNGVNIGQGFSMDRMKWVFLFIIGIFGVFVLLVIARIAARKVIRFAGYHGRDDRENIVAYYRYLCDCLRILNADFQYADSHAVQLRYMMPDASDKERQQLAMQMERISYSVGMMPDVDDALMEKLRQIWKQCRKQYPVKDRFRLFIRM